jgi:hypothetical protein
MDNSIKEIVWNQFGASIDMLISTITNCPDDYFMSNKRFYYIAYHATIYLDYYLTLPPSDFLPQLTFVQKETKYLPKEVIGDLVPDKIYMRQDVLEYLKKSREKCKKMIYALTDEFSVQRFKEGEESNDMNYPVLEILLYNLRHTQHHTAQLNLLLRQDFDKHMEWSFRVGDLPYNE